MAAPLSDEFLRGQLFGKWLEVPAVHRPVGLLWGRRPARQVPRTQEPRRHPKKARREPEKLTPITLSPQDEEALTRYTDQEGLTAAYESDANVVVSPDSTTLYGLGGQGYRPAPGGDG